MNTSVCSATSWSSFSVVKDKTWKNSALNVSKRLDLGSVRCWVVLSRRPRCWRQCSQQRVAEELLTAAYYFSLTWTSQKEQRVLKPDQRAQNTRRNKKANFMPRSVGRPGVWFPRLPPVRDSNWQPSLTSKPASPRDPRGFRFDTRRHGTNVSFMENTVEMERAVITRPVRINTHTHTHRHSSQTAIRYSSLYRITVALFVHWGDFERVLNFVKAISPYLIALLWTCSCPRVLNTRCLQV